MGDEVLEEVRKIREAYGERFGFDIAAIFQDLRRQELASGRKYVSLPPRRIVPTVDVPVLDPSNSTTVSCPSIDQNSRDSAAGMTAKSLGIDSLSIAERINLVEEIWDSILEESDALNLPQSHREELDRRLEARQKSSATGSSRQEVQDRLANGAAVGD